MGILLLCAYWYCANSSSEIFASSSTPFRVPILSSLWIGTLVPTGPFGVSLRNITWLPLCLAAVNPNLLQRILMHSLPEHFLSVRKPCHLKCCENGFASFLHRKFFQI